MALYAWILVGTAFFPFTLSFDRKLQFFRQWKHLLPALLLVAVPYIIFDIILTRAGVWGFNPSYLTGTYWFDLPVEEWLFFIIIPYASIFLHDVIAFYFPKWQLGKAMAKRLTLLLIVACLAILAAFHGRAYTLYSVLMVLISLLLSLWDKSEVTRRFLVTFLIILIPFLAVNGILTGSLIPEEVVWYNPEEITGLRIFTIPAEDTGYAFSMLLLGLLARNLFRALWGRRRQNG